jgi:hypothetical protein
LSGKAIWILLVILASPACVSASPVGVVEGDWWRYGSLGFGFYSDNPEATIPPEMMGTGLAWYQLAVTDVSDTNVALDMTVVAFFSLASVTVPVGSSVSYLRRFLNSSTGTGTIIVLAFSWAASDRDPSSLRWRPPSLC